MTIQTTSSHIQISSPAGCAAFTLGCLLLMLPAGALAETPIIAAPLSSLLAADSKPESLYTQATHAINESRWADAESLFARVAQQQKDLTEAALYWQAYAQNKQNHTESALNTCAQLRKTYPKSRWLDECSALEIEIRSNSGQPLDPQSQPDESLKLLALNAMMRQDAPRALHEIQQILDSAQPESLKEQALFVLAQNPSQQSQSQLQHIADSSTSVPLKSRAQQLLAAIHGPQNTQSHRRIAIDVAVTDNNGSPIHGLSASDFTVLDNGQPQKILGFHPYGDSPTNANIKPDPPTEIMILIDTVNAPVTVVAYERDQLDLLFHTNNGHLAYPVSLSVFTGNGIEPLAPPSRDGISLAATLKAFAGRLPPIRRAQAFYGAVEKLELATRSLSSLASEKAKLPGRKQLIWISPGWPLLRPRLVDTDSELQALFDEIVALSTNLRLARIIVDSIDPSAPGSDSQWALYYKVYSKGIQSRNSAQFGNLGLQVLAEQSGGHAINFTGDPLSKEISDCISQAAADYYLSFDSPPTTNKDEYHSLKVTLNKPNLTAHTRSGYYNQP